MHDCPMFHGVFYIHGAIMRRTAGIVNQIIRISTNLHVIAPNVKFTWIMFKSTSSFPSRSLCTKEKQISH